MRKTLSTAALALAIGLAGPTPIASATSGPAGPSDGPVMVANCVITNDCEVPEPDPDPKVNPNLPASDELTVDRPDPCLELGICPPDDDDDDDPVDPTFPGSDEFQVEEPCHDWIAPCPGGDDDPEEPGDGEDPETPEEPEEPETPETPEGEPGDEEPTDPENPETPDEVPTDDEDGDAGTDIDTPRPGNPNFTG
ncbi:MAG: hypothetical protein AAFO29_17830 [Actinomycetota bacterium]